MSRILLADDSPHAQRMGERILREEGYEVVSVTDGDTALFALDDVDPDLIMADVFLPGRSGLRHLPIRQRLSPRHQPRARRPDCGAAGDRSMRKQARWRMRTRIIKKPFEAPSSWRPSDRCRAAAGCQGRAGCRRPAGGRLS